MRAAAFVAVTLMLGACTIEPHPVGAGQVAVPYTAVGLERVLDQDAAGLAKLFGTPDADVREGPGRRLQFASTICVLDAYLYPKAGEPRVTYLDARTPTGGPIDRASCVAALTRRPAAR